MGHGVPRVSLFEGRLEMAKNTVKASTLGAFVWEDGERETEKNNYGVVGYKQNIARRARWEWTYDTNDYVVLYKDPECTVADLEDSIKGNETYPTVKSILVEVVSYEREPIKLDDGSKVYDQNGRVRWGEVTELSTMFFKVPNNRKTWGNAMRIKAQGNQAKIEAVVTDWFNKQFRVFAMDQAYAVRTAERVAVRAERIAESLAQRAENYATARIRNQSEEIAQIEAALEEAKKELDAMNDPKTGEVAVAKQKVAAAIAEASKARAEADKVAGKTTEEVAA